MIIYKTTDRIEIKIDTITLSVSPYTHHQKTILQEHMMKAVNGDMKEAMISVRKSLSFCLKDIKGVFYFDGNLKKEYKLSFNENQELEENCLDDLLNLPISNKLNSICASFMAGVPTDILDNDGKKVKGIKIIQKGETKGK